MSTNTTAKSAARPVLRNLTPEDLENGYITDARGRTCIHCGEVFRQESIYPVGDQYLTSLGAAVSHIKTEHGGALASLLAMPRKATGITETQSRFIGLMAQGLSDREIARGMNGITESTVRNHRFQLRKRIDEAKVLVAMGTVLDAVEPVASEFVQFHDDMPVSDDRTVVTTEEARRILGKFMPEADSLSLIKFPKKEKEKLVILQRIAGEFQADRIYTEKEVNAILQQIYSDYVTIRRYLIEYRFLNRKPDGSQYWAQGSSGPD